MCAGAETEDGWCDGPLTLPPIPSEKQVESQFFSTQLTLDTDGASERYSTASDATMATACAQQQEACQANQENLPSKNVWKVDSERIIAGARR